MKKVWFWIFILLVISRILYCIIAQKSKNLVYITAAYAVVGMYLISGIDKLYNFGGDDAERLVDKWNKDGYMINNKYQLAQLLVIAGGFMELFGSCLILSSVEDITIPLFTKTMAKTLGVYILVVFTVLATMMFYIFPKIKVLPSISNINAVGGLLALLV